MGKMKIDATPQDICTRAGCTKEKAVSGFRLDGIAA
jgi:hypothetical protein